LAAVSLTVGALLALVREWRSGSIGTVLAFGAGALVSSVAFELAEGGLRIGGPVSVAIGLAVGAVAFFAAARAVSHIGGRSPAADPQGFRWRWAPFWTASRSRRFSASVSPPARASASRCWWQS